MDEGLELVLLDTGDVELAGVEELPGIFSELTMLEDGSIILELELLSLSLNLEDIFLLLHSELLVIGLSAR